LRHAVDRWFRLSASVIKVVIEQLAREGPCPAYGVLTGVVKPAGGAADGSAGLRSVGAAVVAEASADLY
jgi:hypothetical protein